MELVLMTREDAEELQRLRKFMEGLPEYLETVRKEAQLAYQTASFRLLKQREKENPEKHRERSKRLYYAKKEEIQARKKAAAEAAKAEKDREERIARGEMVDEE